MTDRERWLRQSIHLSYLQLDYKSRRCCNGLDIWFDDCPGQYSCPYSLQALNGHLLCTVITTALTNFPSLHLSLASCSPFMSYSRIKTQLCTLYAWSPSSPDSHHCWDPDWWEKSTLGCLSPCSQSLLVSPRGEINLTYNHPPVLPTPLNMLWSLSTVS